MWQPTHGPTGVLVCEETRWEGKRWSDREIGGIGSHLL